MASSEVLTKTESLTFERRSNEELEMTLLVEFKSSRPIIERLPEDILTKTKSRLTSERSDEELKMTHFHFESSAPVIYIERPPEECQSVFIFGKELGSGEFGVTQYLCNHNIESVYTLEKRLGKGGFGSTYLCKHNVTGDLYACKTILKLQSMTLQEMEDVKREVQVMHRLVAQDTIVQLREIYEDKYSIDLVMELCAGGELLKRLKKKKKGYYGEKKAASLCRQIIEGIRTCHSVGVIHRDLKMENILFSTKEKGSSIKLIDFGLSVFFKTGEVFKRFAGSVKYMAPEVYTGTYSKEVDLWSAGVILYVLLCGQCPFESSEEITLEDAVTKGHIRLDFSPWDKVSNGAKDLIRKMLERDPRKRLTPNEVLSHPWIRESGQVFTLVQVGTSGLQDHIAELG